jgi:hypothetical protein
VLVEKLCSVGQHLAFEQLSQLLSLLAALHSALAAPPWLALPPPAGVPPVLTVAPPFVPGAPPLAPPPVPSPESEDEEQPRAAAEANTSAMSPFRRLAMCKVVPQPPRSDNLLLLTLE